MTDDTALLDTLFPIVEPEPEPESAVAAHPPMGDAWAGLPRGVEHVVTFTVFGDAKPAGSKTAGPVTKLDKQSGKRVPVLRQNGMPMTFVKDDSGKPGKAWRQEVAAVARQAMLDAGYVDPVRGVPLVLEVVVVRPRLDSHFGTGRNAGILKDSAPPTPITRPDVLKLARAIEDSMTSIVWHDDSQVVDERLRKSYGSPARAEVRVWRMPATVGESRTRLTGV